MNEYRSGIEETLKPTALKFFATFSRFEFALKRGGYVSGLTGRSASPNWTQFGNDLGVDFYNQMKSAEPAKVFFENSPKRLIVKAERGVEFIDQVAPVNTQTLLEAVSLVRNNLFHGEKAILGERDELLLSAALFVLDSAFQAAQQRYGLRPVCEAFRYAPIDAH